MSIIWAGESKDLTSAASGGKLVKSSYKVTTEFIYVDSGLLKSSSEQIPLWAVRDVDVKQGMIQKARGLFTVTIRCQHDDFTGRSSIIMEDVEGGRELRDLLNQHSEQARREYQKRAQTQHLNYQGTGTVPGVPIPEQPPEASDPIAQLEKLADMKERGILTDEEFAAQKAKILGG
jgi:hypothetical protein